MPPSAIRSLKPFFRPRTVAVVGASREGNGIGHRILESLRGSGFAGSLFPINPHATAIAGLPAYPSLTAVSGPVDLAVIAVPSAVVPTVIDDCIVKQVPAVILITAGFAETGAAGTSLERQLLVGVGGERHLAHPRQAGLRQLLGPDAALADRAGGIGCGQPVQPGSVHSNLTCRK